MSIFAIKKAVPADIPYIVEIQKQTWWNTYEPIIGKAQCDDMFERLYSEESLLNQMGGKQHRFHILERDGAPYGFASYSALDKEGRFKLHKIYVVPGSQGSGAGRFLLSSIEEEARKEGASELRLNVNRHNPARGFYEKMGYSILYEEDIPIGEYWMNDYVMGKKL